MLLMPRASMSARLAKDIIAMRRALFYATPLLMIRLSPFRAFAMPCQHIDGAMIR